MLEAAGAGDATDARACCPVRSAWFRRRATAESLCETDAQGNEIGWKRRTLTVSMSA
jgi:hypothetical protein